MREVGGAEGAGQDGDGVVLGCDVCEGAGAAVRRTDDVLVLSWSGGAVRLDVLFLDPWLILKIYLLFLCGLVGLRLQKHRERLSKNVTEERKAEKWCVTDATQDRAIVLHLDRVVLLVPRQDV